MNGVKFKGRNFNELGSMIEGFAIRKHNGFLLGLWEDLVDGTPVDTGAARSNWILTPGQPGRRVNPRDGTKYPKPSLPDVGKYTYRWRKWYFTNNSVYIKKLNEGSSLQAAPGWIDAAIQRNLIKFGDRLTRTK